jgi:hypothetical protein
MAIHEGILGDMSWDQAAKDILGYRTYNFIFIGNERLDYLTMPTIHGELLARATGQKVAISTLRMGRRYVAMAIRFADGSVERWDSPDGFFVGSTFGLIQMLGVWYVLALVVAVVGLTINIPILLPVAFIVATLFDAAMLIDRRRRIAAISAARNAL